MKTPTIRIVTVAMALFAEPLIAHADVRVNPVDLTPTAVQNSRATYGKNIVTSGHHPGSSTDAAASDTTATSRHTSSTGSHTATTTRRTGEEEDNTTAVNRLNDGTLPRTETAPDAVMLTGVDQQQQQVAPTHTGAIWFASILTLLVAGLIFFSARRRPGYSNNRV